MLFGGIASELPHVRTGRLRAIAVTTPKRLPSLLEIPAVSETVPGYEEIDKWAKVVKAAGIRAD